MKRLWPAVLLLLCCLTTLASASSATDSAAAFPNTGLLVFSDEGSLYTVAPDGSGLRSLGELGAYSPRWSPRGRLIAYKYESDQIRVSRSDGSAARQLTRPTSGARDGDPTWSPSGGRLVFGRSVPARRGVPARSGLRTIRVDGSGSRWLSREAPNLQAPDWSPNGKRIAGHRGPDPGRLWVVDADGSYPRRLGPRNLAAQQPRWSPDGRRVAFLDIDAGSVRVLDLRRGSVRTVFEPEPETYEVEYVGWSYAWSQDGRWLAVQWTNEVACVDDPTTEWCERAEIWIVSASDPRQKQIYTGPLPSTGDGLDWQRAN